MNKLFAKFLSFQNVIKCYTMKLSMLRSSFHSYFLFLLFGQHCLEPGCLPAKSTSTTISVSGPKLLATLFVQVSTSGRAVT